MTSGMRVEYVPLKDMRLMATWGHPTAKEEGKQVYCEEQDRSNHSLVADSLSGSPAALFAGVLLFSLGDRLTVYVMCCL